MESWIELLILIIGVKVIDSVSYRLAFRVVESLYDSEEDSLQWSQYIDGHRSRFYNPIRQNQTHIVALAKFLGIPAEWMTSYVVFSNRCELLKVPDSTAKAVLIHRKNLVHELRYDLRNSPIVFSGEQIEGIRNTLEQFSTGRSKEDHIQDLKEKCPYCGAPLVKRYNKKTGYQFWGCSTYPKCRFVRNMEM